jgi:mediator of RNA polymerase II transcription subunit 18, fungi type
MMQELLLFGQVSAEHHHPLRQQLAGLSRMKPQPVLERHLIFRPRLPPGLSNLPAGSGPQGTQQQELQRTKQLLSAPLNYVQLVGVLDSRAVVSQTGTQPVLGNGGEDHDFDIKVKGVESEDGQKAFEWYLEYKDIPEPGKVPTTSRAMSRTRILEGDPVKFLQDLGYE